MAISEKCLGLFLYFFAAHGARTDEYCDESHGFDGVLVRGGGLAQGSTANAAFWRSFGLPLPRKPVAQLNLLCLTN
jgi:hypothetical protein